MSSIPAELKYSPSHEWVRAEGDAAVVGISDHAQHELTDVVFVELPQKGRRIQAGQPCAVVESVKTASDIYAPLSGEIIDVNPALSENPALVNSDPYGAGWFFKVKVEAPAELAALLDAAAYARQIQG